MVGVIDERGIVGRFGSLKCITVGGEVVFVGFGMDGEVSFLVESFKLAAGLFHGAELWGCGDGVVKDTVAVFQGPGSRGNQREWS